MIYGYIRVSSDKQTVENQRFEINNFCEKLCVFWHIYISPISLTVEVSSAVLATSNFTRSFLRYHFTVSGLRPRQSAICGVV